MPGRAEGSGEKRRRAAPSQSWSELPEARPNAATAVSPDTPSVNTICFDDGIQRNQFGDDLRPGVKLRGAPPAAGIAYISPPITPSSLISPPMNAIVFPSGDQRTLATCIDGFSK